MVSSLQGSKVKFSKVETFGEASKKNDKNAIMAKEDEVVDHSLSDTNRQASGLMWVDKYMPVDTKHIIGQQVRDKGGFLRCMLVIKQMRLTGLASLKALFGTSFSYTDILLEQIFRFSI